MAFLLPFLRRGQASLLLTLPARLNKRGPATVHCCAFGDELRWAIQVSNQGHPACKAGALPLS